MIALMVCNTDSSRPSQGGSCWTVQVPSYGSEWISQEWEDPH